MTMNFRVYWRVPPPQPGVLWPLLGIRQGDGTPKVYRLVFVDFAGGRPQRLLMALTRANMVVIEDAQATTWP
jgi:hypothetical protein